MIIPSIDIKNGKVVQLRQGRETVLIDRRPPAELARYFTRFGPVAVIDLDAALGIGSNTELVAECCRVARCRVGGGIRSEEDVRRWIRRGAEKVIIGTAATPEFLRRFPRDWIIGAVDARNEEVVVEGWQKPTGKNVHELADCNDGCPNDPDKVDPGLCGCGQADEGDSDGDGVLDCVDQCNGVDDAVFAPECAVAIPAASTWGMVALVLFLLALAKVCFARRFSSS